MVGVGVAEGGGGGGGPGDYYGEYYPQEPYFVPPEMCQHPQQHPQHAHMCTMHTDYGGMPVVTSTAMMPPMLPAVLEEGMRHYLVPPQHAHPPPHPQPHHQPPRHHQPHHHYGPANGGGGPQHFYNAGYPPHFHHVPAHPHHMQPSPPPPAPAPHYQKDERTQRQYCKLKQKLERKHVHRNNGIEVNSGASTPSLSPRKELNGRGGGSGGASSGAWSEGEGSSAGASLTGDDDDTQAVLDLISATRIPQVSEITPISALVQWNSPLPEGVSLPNLNVTYDLLLGDRGRGGYKAIYSGPSLSCRVRDLKPGLEYSVCLQVRCGDAASGPGEAATFRAPAAPPAAPSPPRVTQRTRNSLLLRWQAAVDNGARILNYSLEMDSGDGWVEITRPRTRQHTVNNLRSQTRYRFRVAAENECGKGAWSEEIVAWTMGAPPTAPPPPSLARAESNSLALTWEKKADEEFTLQMDDAARGHGFLPVYSGPEREYVCANLRRATDYRFRLRCETSEGQSPWSAEVSYRTGPERPGPPGRPSAKGKVHSRAFRLRWDPPTDDGGATIDTYTLELDSGEGFCTAYQGAEREAHCDRLQPGTPYRARVKAASCAGSSEWSGTETVTTEAALPQPCAQPENATEPRATLAAIRWKAPECTGGAPLTEYRVEISDEEGSVRLAHQGLETQCIIRDLNPGSTYKVWVIACNRVGSSPPSPILQFRTAPAPPEAPSIPEATIETPKSARLEWTPPNDNGAPILDYRLEMSASNVENAFALVYRGANTTYTIDQLTPFSPYFFRVCASNSAGRGAWSAVRDILTPRAPPAAPIGLRHESTPDTLVLYWQAPSNHGAEIQSYRVKVNDVHYDTEGPTTQRLVEGLQPDTTYRVRVAAVNDLGLGDWSEEASASTRPLPPPPPLLRAAPPAHNHIKLEWAPAGVTGIQARTQYCVEMSLADGREPRLAYRGSARSCKVKRLKEATTYQFRIRASDERGGLGPWSEPISVQTISAPPPAPRTPEITLINPRTAQVTWETAEDCSYVLQCAKAKDNVFKQVYEGPAPHYQLEDLEPGSEYTVRVCLARGGLSGPWSPAARLALPALPPPQPRTRKPRALSRLTPTMMGLVLAVVLVIVAVVMAVLVQRLVEPRSRP